MIKGFSDLGGTSFLQQGCIAYYVLMEGNWPTQPEEGAGLPGFKKGSK